MATYFAPKCRQIAERIERVRSPKKQQRLPTALRAEIAVGENGREERFPVLVEALDIQRAWLAPINAAMPADRTIRFRCHLGRDDGSEPIRDGPRTIECRATLATNSDGILEARFDEVSPVFIARILHFFSSSLPKEYAVTLR
jgi:hypothetical protein